MHTRRRRLHIRLRLQLGRGLSGGLLRIGENVQRRIGPLVGLLHQLLPIVYEVVLAHLIGLHLREPNALRLLIGGPRPLHVPQDLLQVAGLALQFLVERRR